MFKKSDELFLNYYQIIKYYIEIYLSFYAIFYRSSISIFKSNHSDFQPTLTWP